VPRLGVRRVVIEQHGAPLELACGPGTNCELVIEILGPPDRVASFAVYTSWLLTDPLDTRVFEADRKALFALQRKHIDSFRGAG